MHAAQSGSPLPFAEAPAPEQPSLLDAIIAETIAKPVPPAPKVAPKPVAPVAKPAPAVARRASVAPTWAPKVGDFVWYTAKSGKRRRYRVSAVGRNGVVWLTMLGHFDGDRLKGRRFPTPKGTPLVLDQQPSRGRRVCTVCGESSCNIGPFAVR